MQRNRPAIVGAERHRCGSGVQYHVGRPARWEAISPR
jgi:hypothetical protein